MMKRRIRNLSLKYKLISILLFNSFVIILCALWGYHLYIQTCSRLLFHAVASNLTSTSHQISEKLENIEALSTMIAASPSMQNILSDLAASPDVITKSYYNKQLNGALLEYSSSLRSSGISYIALYNSQFTNCTNWALLNKTNPEIIATARKNGLENQGAVTWTYSSRGDNLCLSRSIRQVENMSFKPIGELIIGVDLNRIVEDTTHAFTLYEDLQYIITNKEGRLIYASDTLSSPDATYFIEKTNDSYQTISYNQHTYFVVGGVLPDYEYRYLSLTPFDTISESLRMSLKIILIMFALGFGFIVFISNRLIRSIVRQFDALMGKMQTFSRNELILPDKNNYYSRQYDEIGTLHRQFDLMANHIHDLVKVNYVNEILTKDARLKALKSQINPHFLYNTLETINWRAKAVGNETISRIVESLGTLLRASLSNQASLVTLACELELVESYMTIQKIRFEDRLDYQIDVADSKLTGALIPPLSIQPLAENAIHYGMEEMTEVCHIRIHITYDDSLLIISVQNEGSHFEEDLLVKLRTNQKKPGGLGIGITNIDQRIKLLFGNEYGLSFYNEDAFAVAVIKIPCQNEELPC